MKPTSNQQLVKKFIALIQATDDPVRKQAIYDSAYAYAVIAGRDFVKFQPDFFMRFIQSESGFIPEVQYGFRDEVINV
jgi:hypothetical protein